MLIPFSVSLEQRLADLATPEEKAEEEKNIGATSALGKITHIGYTSLDVRLSFLCIVSQLTRTISVDSVLHLWSGRGPGLDNSEGHQGTPGGRCHPVRSSTSEAGVSVR